MAQKSYDKFFGGKVKFSNGTSEFGAVRKEAEENEAVNDDHQAESFFGFCFVVDTHLRVVISYRISCQFSSLHSSTIAH